MQYEIEAPAKKGRSLASRAWSLALCITLGAGMAGVIAWSWVQINKAAAVAAFPHPKLITDAAGDVSCVRWMDSISCVGRQVDDEPMPEPLGEMSYDEAQQLVAKLLKP